MKAKILIVDDESLNRKLIKATFSQEPYDIIEASDGYIALEQIKANPPDLILLDVMMPRLDGWGVIKILKRNPETMYIPIIFLTALDNPTDKLKALELGADEYLGKPINLLELKSLVKSMIKLKIHLDENKNGSSEKDRYRNPDKTPQ